MKYIVLIGDGMADELIPDLGNKTPLEVAKTPNMDWLARNGLPGTVRTVPKGYKPGSDVANLAILGYDPKDTFTGRAPLEAASAGIDLEENDVAYRCNLVTIDKDIMEDYSAGHITTEEATELIASLNQSLASSAIQFYPGISYRHLLVIKNGPCDVETTPPHDLTGHIITGDGPEGPGAEILTSLIEKSAGILANHAVNQKRVAEGKKPANMIWLWGLGKKPVLTSFYSKYNKTGTIITAVDLLKGIGKIIGLDTPLVPGATGYVDTDYSQKVAYALKAIETQDMVYLHIEAPDEAAHQGDIKLKIKAIEDFDQFVVGPMLEAAKKFKDFKILLLPDHATPTETMTHSAHPVPFVIYSSGKNLTGKVNAYSEVEFAKATYHLDEGYKLLEKLFSEV